MKLGIFAKTFDRPTVEQVFETVRMHGLTCVQFNMSCVGLSSMPDEINPSVRSRIREAAVNFGVEIEAVSGTYNMIHPNTAVRQTGLHRLRTLARACHNIGAPVITLCTGTRDVDDMWRWHDDNASPQAWADLLQAMEAAVRIAEEEQVTLAFEPERANVVNSAKRGHALLTTMQSPRLKVVIDPANIVVPGDAQEMEYVVEEAFDLLGDHIIIAHAKDRGTDDDFRTAGQGILNYDHYLELLHKHSFTGPLIIHGLPEAQVSATVQFLNNKIQGE